jgi:deazaflavin-dependent oxidoreductase (nitroreductase family)
MRLRTVGRRTGAERTAILGYFDDGPNLVTMAMNGWADPEPAWWLNLQAHPDASVELADGPRAVRARAADEDESPPSGQVYRCSIEHNGSRVVVGEMRFSGSLAYWAGTLDSWGATPAAGSRFLVSLEPMGGGSSGTPVLSGTL